MTEVARDLLQATRNSSLFARDWTCSGCHLRGSARNMRPPRQNLSPVRTNQSMEVATSALKIQISPS